MNHSHLLEYGKNAKSAARLLSTLSTNAKNSTLLAIAAALVDNCTVLLSANQIDINNGIAAGFSDALLDRLRLNPERVAAISDAVLAIAKMADPVGETERGWLMPNELEIRKIRVPLGVVCMIYEARPNVTVDAAVLCFKTGNACILRGGKEAINSNIALAKVIGKALSSCNIPETAVQLITTTDRNAINELLKMNEYIDVVIPRGGAGLIKYVKEHSSVPIIETGTGVCHIFVDSSADFETALKIILNAKTSRPAVCNALESLLVHQNIAQTFMPLLITALQKNKVEIRGCDRTQIYGNNIKPATDCDWHTEYLDLILSIKIVDNIDAALQHIAEYSTKHSEAILTNDLVNAARFQREVDSAAVYVNASTRFTDGYEFGFGAEIGISTQKLHARGPMGLNELTSMKYLINGNGQIR